MLRALGLDAHAIGAEAPRVSARRLAISGRNGPAAAPGRSRWRRRSRGALPSRRPAPSPPASRTQARHALHSADRCPGSGGRGRRGRAPRAAPRRSHGSSTSASEWPPRPALGRDGHAAEHQRAPLHQRMEVEAEAGAGHAQPRPARRPARGRLEILGRRDLEVLRRAPRTIATGAPSRSTSIASSVPTKPSRRALSCASHRSSRRNACGVWVSQSPSRSSVASHHGLPHALDRLPHGEAAGGRAVRPARRPARARSAPA